MASSRLAVAAAPAAAGSALTTTETEAASLSPEQLRFNKLLQRNQTLSGKIAAVLAQGERLRQHFLETLHPLDQRAAALRQELALQLDARLQQRGLTARLQRLARESLCAIAAPLALSGDTAMRALHDRYAGKTLAQQEREQAAQTQEMLERLLGRRLGPEQGFANAREVLQASMAHMDAHAQARDSAREERAERRARRPKSAKQAQAVQHALDADTALRSVYRQIASAVHPDREADPQMRVRKTGWMSEANAAYARRDLMALLQLQQRSGKGAEVLAPPQGMVHALSLLLQQRSATLTQELRTVEQRLRSEFTLPDRMPLANTSLDRHMELEQRAHQLQIDTLEDDLLRLQDDTRFTLWLKADAQRRQVLADARAHGSATNTVNTPV